MESQPFHMQFWGPKNLGLKSKKTEKKLLTNTTGEVFLKSTFGGRIKVQYPLPTFFAQRKKQTETHFGNYVNSNT